MPKVLIEAIAWGDVTRLGFACMRRVSDDQWIAPDANGAPVLSSEPGYWPLGEMPKGCAPGKRLRLEIDEQLVATGELHVSFVAQAGDPVPVGTNVTPPPPSVYYAPIVAMVRSN